MADVLCFQRLPLKIQVDIIVFIGPSDKRIRIIRGKKVFEKMGITIQVVDSKRLIATTPVVAALYYVSKLLILNDLHRIRADFRSELKL